MSAKGSAPVAAAGGETADTPEGGDAGTTEAGGGACHWRLWDAVEAGSGKGVEAGLASSRRQRVFLLRHGNQPQRDEKFRGAQGRLVRRGRNAEIPDL